MSVCTNRVPRETVPDYQLPGLEGRVHTSLGTCVSSHASMMLSALLSGVVTNPPSGCANEPPATGNDPL